MAPAWPLQGASGVAVAGSPASVSRLRPAMTRIEGEVVAGYADPGGPVQAGAPVYGQRLGTGLLVDKIVRAGHQDIGRIRIQGHRRLILMILRRVARRATGADTA